MIDSDNAVTDAASEIFDAYENGNFSTVKDLLRGMSPLSAAIAVARVMETLSTPGERSLFAKRLEAWT